MEKLVLYDYFRSSASFRVRAGLHFKGIPFESINVHLVRNGGEHLAQPYLGLNPMGEVPCLKHGPRVLVQSMAILHYLEDLRPFPSFFPNSSWDKAQVIQIAEIVNTGIHPLQNLKVLSKIKRDWGSEARRTEWARHWIERGFKGLEKIVSRTAGTFAFGGHLTIADLFIIPQMYNARRFQVDTTPFPTLRRIESVCMNLDCFKKSAPEAMPDFTASPT